MKTPTRAFSVRTDRLVDQLNWLRENGYQAVSVDQILAARQPGGKLPERAVLLTFDDGYRSFLTRVLPILKAHGWPAVLAPVGTWMDTPADRKVDFGGNMQPRDRFLTGTTCARSRVPAWWRSPPTPTPRTTARWPIPRAIPSRPPPCASTTRAMAATRTRPASSNAWAATWPRSAKRSAAPPARRRASGPYGAEGGTTLRIAGEQGYQMALTLEDGPSVGRLMSTPRMLLANDPTIRHFANSVASIETVPAMRVAHVDLDYIYDPDPAQTDRNLGELVQRIVDMQINTVFLQAYADPQADGLVRSVYFPERWLPMRADLFNRVAWQLHNRADVVYAWMPVLALDLDPSIARVVRWDPKQPEAAPAPDPTCTDGCRRSIRSRASASATCTKTWRAMPSSTASCSTMTRCWATSRTPARRRWPACPAASRCAPIPRRCSAGPATRAATWSISPPHWPSAPAPCAARASRPLATCTPSAAQPASEAWFAQNPDDFLDAYDWTAPMAMPYMEKVPAGQELAWLDRIVDAVARRRPDALDRTVFELQAVDWRTGPGRLSRRPSTPRRWPAGCSACSAARAASATTRRFLARPAPAARHPARHLRSVVPHPMIDRLLALLILCAVLSAPFGFALALTSQALLGFVFFYPLFMSGLWMAGGLYYWWHWERHWAWGARAKRRPWPAIRWFPSWCPATTRPTTAKTRCWPR